MIKKFTLLFVFTVVVLFPNFSYGQERHRLLSPDKKIELTVDLSNLNIQFNIRHQQTVVISSATIGLLVDEQPSLYKEPKLINTASQSVKEIIETPFYKRKNINNEYNELTLFFKNDYKIVFRAFNSGIAYRFETSFNDEIKIKDELAMITFDSNYTVYAPYANSSRGLGNEIEKQFMSSFENTYNTLPIKELNPQKLIFLPMMISLKDNKKLVITEANLEDYPGMYLQNQNNTTTLKATFATYPKTVVQGGHNNLQYIVSERESFIAQTKGSRTFPWRIMAISDNDIELADNDLVYALADPSRVDDISWIKPGKVAWDWWNNWNLYHVNFETGINNETYRYYIDFASKFGIDYVILDEGWAVNKEADLLQVIPEIDLPALVKYAQSKNVGIVLWAGYAAIDKDMDNICRHYSQMGIKGFKVDFMDRDDQQAVNFYYRMAETAAKYQLFIDFHGAYKPTGLQRTYPNVLNFEGVFGLEQAKWMDRTIDHVTYEVTIPYIRMVAGQMDFTQGAMRNATKDNFRGVYTEPMSQGTRCRQLAEYIVFEAPFSMLCDAPTAYEQETECTQFISKIPTTWNETVVIDGKVGEYIVIARKKNNKWYIGAMTNWTERDLELDLSFIANISQIELFKDGVNASKVASDYSKEIITTPNTKSLPLHLAPGGGAALIIE